MSTTAALIECCVCGEPYNEHENVPRMLPMCGHTLCEQCLGRVGQQESGSFSAQCPTCRKPTKLADAGLFPKNFALLEHIRAVKARETQVVAPTCDDCQENPAKFFCGNCEVTYCPACWDRAHRLGRLAAHQREPITDVPQVEQCAKHRGIKIKYVCIENDCPARGEAICLLCKKLPRHNGHRTDSLDQLADESRRKLKSAIDRMQECVALGMKALAHVNNTDELLRGNHPSTKANPDAHPSPSNKSKAIAEIREQCKQLIDLVHQREAALILQVEAVAVSKAAKLEQQRVELSEFLQRSYSALQDAADAVKGCNGLKLVSSSPKLCERLTELSEKKLFPEAVVTATIDVSFGTELYDAIQMQGVVVDDDLVTQVRLSCSADGKETAALDDDDDNIDSRTPAYSAASSTAITPNSIASNVGDQNVSEGAAARTNETQTDFSPLIIEESWIEELHDGAPTSENDLQDDSSVLENVAVPRTERNTVKRGATASDDEVVPKVRVVAQARAQPASAEEVRVVSRAHQASEFLLPLQPPTEEGQGENEAPTDRFGCSVPSKKKPSSSSSVSANPLRHVIKWNQVRCHKELEVSSGGSAVKCTGRKATVCRICYGIPNNAPNGFKSGVHSFRVRVVDPSKNGFIFVGVTNDKLSTTQHARPGSFGDLGVGLQLVNGRIYFRGNSAAATKGTRGTCSVSVLLDLEAPSISFFVDGANELNNGPCTVYSMPRGETWLPYVGLYTRGAEITSEVLT